MRNIKIIFLLVCFMLLQPALAAEEDGIANYAYSVFIGTGAYRIGDRTIYLLRIPGAFDLSEPDYDSGKIGWRLLLPFTVGVTNFDDIEDIPELTVNDLQSMTIAPGVEAQIPFQPNWLLKPFVQAGLGWDMKSSSNSFIYGLGSRLRGWYGDNQQLLLGGEFLWAGNNPKKQQEPDSNFTRLGLGLEYKYQTPWYVFDRHVSLHGRLIHWEYVNAANLEPPIDPIRIERSTEVGISFGLNPGINILGYNFRQGGIGYERSDEFKAVKLFTTFPF